MGFRGLQMHAQSGASVYDCTTNTEGLHLYEFFVSALPSFRWQAFSDAIRLAELGVQ